jgi:hypothetical protein
MTTEDVAYLERDCKQNASSIYLRVHPDVGFDSGQVRLQFEVKALVAYCKWKSKNH